MDIKILQSNGVDEEILDLKDAPEFVLVDFCYTVLRHHDLRDAGSQNLLRQLNQALKAKSEMGPADDNASDRRSISKAIEEIDSILDRFTKTL